MTGQVDVNVNFGQASPSLALHRGGRPFSAGSRDDRPLRNQEARQLPPEAQGSLRHRRVAVRRPRRQHQHHAAHPAEHGRRGDPSRAQPLGGGNRDRRPAGRRAGHRGVELPGRARRVLQVHARPLARTGRCRHPRVRRRRRRDRRRRDQGTARLRRGAHLLAGRRPEDGPRRNDRADGGRVRPRPRQGGADVARCTEGQGRDQALARAGATDHRARTERRRREAASRRCTSRPTRRRCRCWA